VTILIALGLAACGTSGPSGFTARGRPPLDPSQWTSGYPTPEMADETEALIIRKHGDLYASPKCVPAESLDGTGEFNFDCTAELRECKKRFQLDVVVFGSKSGEPELGSILVYLHHPGRDKDGRRRSCR
jgi:hypothetical protein